MVGVTPPPKGRPPIPRSSFPCPSPDCLAAAHTAPAAAGLSRPEFAVVAGQQMLPWPLPAPLGGLVPLTPGRRRAGWRRAGRRAPTRQPGQRQGSVSELAKAVVS